MLQGKLFSRKAKSPERRHFSRKSKSPEGRRNSFPESQLMRKVNHRILLKKRSPRKIVSSTQRKLTILQNLEKQKVNPNSAIFTKASHKITINLRQMKCILYGNDSQPPNYEIIEQLLIPLIDQNILLLMLESIHLLDFEAQNDISLIYMFLLRQKPKLAAEYLTENPTILTTLVDGYKEINMAHKFGKILRAAIRTLQIHKMILYSDGVVRKFFCYIQLSIFDVATDAFSTFKLMLTNHQKLCAEFLDKNFDRVFQGINMLLQCNNYATKRQAINFLCQLLRVGSNHRIMIRYINMGSNLMISMKLLKEKKKSLQLDAFNLFTIFVTNPIKSDEVEIILCRNKKVLCSFLQRFENDSKDQEFQHVREIVLDILKKLQAPKISDAYNKSNQ